MEKRYNKTIAVDANPEPVSYEDSWPSQVTRRELKRELESHGLTLGDWDAEHGEIQEYYNSREVLGWLGY